MAKSINLFLIDDGPPGRIKCTLQNWTGVAYKIPRNLLGECYKSGGNITTHETLDLIKKLNYVVYDDLISKNKFDSIEISVFNNEEEDKKKLEVLNILVADDQDEVPFSKYISFQIKGNENNLLNDYYYILLKTIKIF